MRTGTDHLVWWGVQVQNALMEVSRSPWKIVKYMFNSKVMSALKVCGPCKGVPARHGATTQLLCFACSRTVADRCLVPAQTTHLAGC
jgi:hypothetical protein